MPYGGIRCNIESCWNVVHSPCVTTQAGACKLLEQVGFLSDKGRKLHGPLEVYTGLLTWPVYL